MHPNHPMRTRATRADMLKAIQEGGSVMLPSGHIITKESHLPSELNLATMFNDDNPAQLDKAIREIEENQAKSDRMLDELKQRRAAIGDKPEVVDPADLEVARAEPKTGHPNQPAQFEVPAVIEPPKPVEVHDTPKGNEPAKVEAAAEDQAKAVDARQALLTGVPHDEPATPASKGGGKNGK